MTRRRRVRRGHTLAEVLISTLVVSVIMGAMVSLMLMGTRALRTTAGDVSDSGDVLDQVITDLNLAKSFGEQTATTVTMTVPDRDGDSQDETIRYSWSGTAGDSLMRTYNGGTPVAVADNVYYFDLAYLTKTVGGG